MQSTKDDGIMDVRNFTGISKLKCRFSKAEVAPYIRDDVVQVPFIDM